MRKVCTFFAAVSVVLSALTPATQWREKMDIYKNDGSTAPLEGALKIAESFGNSDPPLLETLIQTGRCVRRRHLRRTEQRISGASAANSIQYQASGCPLRDAIDGPGRRRGRSGPFEGCTAGLPGSTGVARKAFRFTASVECRNVRSHRARLSDDERPGSGAPYPCSTPSKFDSKRVKNSPPVLRIFWKIPHGPTTAADPAPLMTVEQ
jgi:hypothetical protein